MALHTQADMGGWTRNSLATSLPQPLLRWSSLWHSVIRPVVHHNVMLRNRVPPPHAPRAVHVVQPPRDVAHGHQHHWHVLTW